MKHDIVVIIPVYNAFSDTIECLESVLAYSNEASKILLIDDASPEGDLKTAIPEELLNDRRVEVRRNESNQGFVKTCNIGMYAAERADVVLLNSDTIVTPNWLKKLHVAAYTRENVGSVTPFSNNATICSLPYFCEDNVLPCSLELNDFAELVERVALPQYPDLPTCVGFCVYLRREALDASGPFNEDAFGRGYGEENDLSCRMQKLGYHDILDDSTFVFHKGSTSFKEDKAALVEENSETMRKLHPHYFDDVAKFCQRNSLAPVRLPVLDALVELWSNRQPKRVLHILQNGPRVARREMLGGTERHVYDLIRDVEGVAHWSLVPDKTCYYLTAHFPGGDRDYILELNRTSLDALLRPEFFDLVHLHHSRFIDHVELCDALVAHGNYMVSFHDFILVCPRFHLYTPFRKLCNGHECAESCGYGEDYIAEYRERSKALFDGARKLVCFSKSTKNHLLQIVDGDFNWEEQPHAIHNVDLARGDFKISPDPKIAKRPLRVLLLGTVPQHKGSLIVEEFLKNTRLENGVDVEIHMLGKLFLETTQVVDHGDYDREELHERLKGLDVDLVCILTICPETYCLTLDEAWNAGIPALVTPLGAPPERVQQSGAGWVVDELTVTGLRKALTEISSDWQDYEQKVANVANTRILKISEESAAYADFYVDCLDASPVQSFEPLKKYLSMFGLVNPPVVSATAKILGKIANKVVYLLDSVGVRGHVQRMAYAYIPRGLLESIKMAR